jgi:hypothetical protein
MKHATFSSLSLTKAVAVTLLGLGLAAQQASAATVAIDNLQVNASHPVAGSGISIQTSTLTIAAGSTLSMDVTANTPLQASRNALIWQAPDEATRAANFAAMVAWTNSANNGGLWTGTGVTSQAAAVDAGINGVLAVMRYDNSQLGFTNFGGITGLDTTGFLQTLVKTTYLGDFDASGFIDGTDYAFLDAYLGASLFAQGDLNADGIIDGGDYAFLDAVLGAQVYGNLAAGNVPLTGGVVPEPTSAALLLVAGLALAGRRRTKS